MNNPDDFRLTPSDRFVANWLVETSEQLAARQWMQQRANNDKRSSRDRQPGDDDE